MVLQDMPIYALVPRERIRNTWRYNPCSALVSPVSLACAPRLKAQVCPWRIASPLVSAAGQRPAHSIKKKRVDVLQMPRSGGDAHAYTR